MNLRLEVGAVSESIEVTASAPVLNTDNAVRGDVVANKEILEMPLNGRNAHYVRSRELLLRSAIAERPGLRFETWLPGASFRGGQAAPRRGLPVTPQKLIFNDICQLRVGSWAVIVPNALLVGVVLMVFTLG